MEVKTRKEAEALLEQTKRDLIFLLKLKEKGLILQRVFEDQLNLYLEDINYLNKMFENLSNN